MKKKIAITHSEPRISIDGTETVQVFWNEDIPTDAAGDNVFEMEEYNTSDGRRGLRLASADPKEIARFKRWNRD